MVSKKQQQNVQYYVHRRRSLFTTLVKFSPFTSDKATFAVNKNMRMSAPGKVQNPLTRAQYKAVHVRDLQNALKAVLNDHLRDVIDVDPPVSQVDTRVLGKWKQESDGSFFMPLVQDVILIETYDMRTIFGERKAYELLVRVSFGRSIGDLFSVTLYTPLSLQQLFEYIESVRATYTRADGNSQPDEEGEHQEREADIESESDALGMDSIEESSVAE